MDLKTIQKQRDARAKKAGEGWYLRLCDRAFVFVEATLYPKPQLWLEENGERRCVTREELERDFEPHTPAPIRLE